MVRTRVGYAGGKKINPTYHSLGDHTETIQVDYDASQVNYKELLQIFWNSHEPSRPAWSCQYKSVIFYQDEDQKKIAMESKKELGEKLQREVFTEILPVTKFYLAEAYHQKYMLRMARSLMKEFSAIYPQVEDFVASTATARVNGYLGGNGTSELLKAEVGSLGLSAEASRVLLARVCSMEE